MSSQPRRAIFAAMIMILASLAGCIGSDDLAPGEDTESLGTVIASTYHVEQLASAVGGDLVTVEMMSTMNVPVHDYEPSAQDIIRLNQADVFFYHGLGLEPWVEGALANLESDGPVAVGTHAMPSGETALDFESLLIDNLCTSMTEPATTDVHLLAEHAEDADELHSDDGGHNLAFPEDDHDEDHHDEGGHDEDHHDEDGHDEDHHDEDGHDGHDHGEEGMVTAEETIEDPAGCPSGTVISVYQLEAGEYMLEFEAEDMETFRMAIAAMGGAHHHHHHGDEHGDEHGEEHHVCHDMTTHENHDEYTTEEECEAAGHSWMEDAHAGEEGPVCHDEDTHENHNEYETEEACEAAGYHWMEDDHDDHDGHGDHDGHDDEMTPEEAMSSFDTNNDSNLSWDEFWVAWNMDDDDDHDEHDHEDEHHDENESSDDDHDEHGHEDEHSPLEEALEGYMMEMLMTMFNESDADNSGGLSLEELEHFIEDIDDMEDDDLGMPGGDFIVDAFDEDGDSALSFEEFSEMMGMEHDDHDHDDNGTHDENESAEEELMEAMMEMMFNMTDMNGDGFLNASEVEMMFEMMDDEDDHHEEGVAFIGLHVEEEGDYGIALPAGVSLHVLMEESHDGHDHGDHNDHNDHGDEHGDGFEWAGVFEMDDSTHTWSMQKVDGDYADPTMWLVLIPTDTPTESTMHALESDVDALVDAGCTVVEDGESMSSIASEGSCFELHVGTGDDSTYTIDTAGITGMAMYAQHVPTEFERDQHYLKDSAGTDIEPVAQEGAGAHDHGHGNEEIAFDPHSWLDPVAFAAQVEVVYVTLSTTFPDGADTFRANADAYKAQLLALDEDFSSALGEAGTCTTDTVAANHNAYAYISQRYGIEFVTLHGLDPEGEPSPETVAEVLERVEEDGITVIYVEEYSPNGALDSLIQQTVSDDLPNGLAILTLYTMEVGPSDASGDDYLSLMGKNLENLKTGLGC